MVDFIKNTPQVPVVLASLLFWFSFAWGLPAEAAEGSAEAATEDVWGGVKISDAYDYAKCAGCDKKNETRAEACARCGYELPQPSAAFTYPPWVFIPGKGYYREGTLLEPPKTRKGYWITGLVLFGSGIPLLIILHSAAGPWDSPVGLVSLGMMSVGAGLVIYGLVARTKPVYAFAGGELYEPYERPAFTLRSADSDGAALKIEVTVLGF